METLYSLIAHYGYLAIYALLMLGIVGLPIPDETLLTLSGYLVFSGHLHLIPTFLSAFLGSISGISISYAIGATFGHIILIKYGHYIHITEERLKRAHIWFEKIGRWSLLVGYFIPGVRHIIAILAGASELQMREFALFSYSGAFIWTSTFFSIGYFFGHRWERVFLLLRHHLMIISTIVFIVIILFYFIKKIFDNKKKSSTKKEN
jgi:membrane protein DedA with SNARE-associated domain